jgi:hypothetical protein
MAIRRSRSVFVLPFAADAARSPNRASAHWWYASAKRRSYVAVHGAERDAGMGGDVADLDVLAASFAEELEGGVDDPLASLRLGPSKAVGKAVRGGGGGERWLRCHCRSRYAPTR